MKSKTEAITLTESKRLIQLEKMISDSLHSSSEALKEIRDKRLYRSDYSTFEEYCQEKWGWTRQRGFQIIEAGEVLKTLPESCQQIVVNESQARALSKIPPRSREKVLEKIQKSGEPVTAAAISAHIPPPRKSSPPPPPPRPAKKVEPVAPPATLDEIGRAIPDVVLPLWERRHEIQELVNLAQRVKNVVEKAEKEKDALFAFLNFQRVVDGLANAIAELKAVKPYSLCIECHGKNTETCTACRHTGFIGRFAWDHQSKEESKAMVLKSLKK